MTAGQSVKLNLSEKLQLRIGAYQKGSDKELDLAISKKEFMESFLKQSSEEAFALEEVEELLDKINQ